MASCDIKTFAKRAVIFIRVVFCLHKKQQDSTKCCLNDIELLQLAGARSQVKVNQAVIQDSPGHLQSIPAQSQLKLAGSVDGHQFLYKLNAILKSKQSQCGLHWFNGSFQVEWTAKSARRTQVGRVSLINGVVCVDAV